MRTILRRAALALPALSLTLAIAAPAEPPGPPPAEAAAATSKSNWPSSESLRHYRAFSNPQLSPAGDRALLQVMDPTADGGKSHLWLIDVAGGPPRQLTYAPAADKRGEHDGVWTPDGQSVLFLARRGEHTSLFELPMSGGEAHELDIKAKPAVDESSAPDALPPRKSDAPKPAAEPLPLDIDSFGVSPDGTWIAFIAADPQTPGEKAQQDAKADAEWVDHTPHGSRLYLLRRSTGDITPVGVPVDVRHLAWKPDSSGLLALAQAPHHQADLGPAASSWEVNPAQPEHPQNLSALPATVETAVWTTQGSLLYFAQAHRDTPPGYSDLYVLDPANGLSRNLTDGLDGSVGREEPVSLPDGTVVQLIEHGLTVTVGLHHPGATVPELLPLPVATVQNLRTNVRRTGWLLLGSSARSPGGLYYTPVLGKEPTALKTPALVPADTATVLAAEHLQWKSGGLTIEGLLYKPAAASQHPVPLIVEVHGGPLGAYHDEFAPWVDFLVGQGWAVLRSNPRGSTGRGAAFAAANKNDLGGGDYRDIMAGVDHVLMTEPINPARMALIGYSYGGEMAGFVEGSTVRFKAIVSGAPVIDQHSEYGTETDSWYDRWYFGKPWEHPADAWRQSPLSKVGSAHTPFLLLQGQADTTDPLGQSQEMYRALRQMGVPVDLVTYPRESHGGLSAGLYGRPSPEAWHGLDARNRVIAFIKKAFGETH